MEHEPHGSGQYFEFEQDGISVVHFRNNVKGFKGNSYYFHFFGQVLTKEGYIWYIDSNLVGIEMQILLHTSFQETNDF